MRILNGLRRLLGGSATSVEQGTQHPEPDHYSQQSASMVTEDTALQVSAVWACSRLITEVFGSLPISMHQTNGTIKTPIDSHPILTLLNVSPNSRMTPVEFKETMQLNLVMHGNAYARIERNRTGQIIALWPLPAQHVEPVLMSDGTVIYNWYHGTDVSVISSNNILHVKLFGNGLVGLSPLAYARNAVGLASAADNYSSKYFVNGGKPSGVLYTDMELTNQQRQLARENFKEVVEQREESDRLLVLPLGFKFQSVQMSPSDMQMLDSRKYQTKELCRFFGNVPPVLIGETDGTTTLGSSLEQILIGWYRLGLNPYATRWEEALAKKLLTPAERLRTTFHVDFTALTRGDSKTQMEYLKGMVGGPIMTPNEARAEKNLPPVEGGDKLNPAPTEGRKATDTKEVTPHA